MTLRRGVRIAVDVGSVRIGVAACDPAGVLATPLETVRRGNEDLARIAQLVAEREAIEVIVGLPLTLSGTEGPAAADARAYADRLAGHVAPCPVRLVDERMTTASAAKAMRAAGVSARQGRDTVDQAAAVAILQGVLDYERSSGRAPGELVWVEPQ